MPDPGVNQRLAALETALSTRHTETTNQLNSILLALGAPPPGATTTLEDVVVAITAGNALLTDIKQLLTDMHLDTMSMDLKLLTIKNQQIADSARLESVRVNTLASDTKLGTLLLTADTMRSNLIAINSQTYGIENAVGLVTGDASTTVLGYLKSIQYAVPRIYDAIWATSCCENLPTALPPPLGVNPITVNPVHCQRVQYFIDEIAAESYRRLGEAAAAGGALSVVVLAALLAPPTGGASLSLIAGTSLVASGTSIGSYMISTEFDITLKTQLRQALYAAEYPAEAKESWDSVISNSGVALPIQAVWKWFPFNGNFNDLYDPAVVWNVSAYDGSVCTLVPTLPPVTISSVLTSASPGIFPTSQQMIPWNVYPSQMGTTDASRTFSQPVMLNGDYFGYQIRASISGVKLIRSVNGVTLNPNIDLPSGSWYTIAEHTDQIRISTGTDAPSFMIDFSAT